MSTLPKLKARPIDTFGQFAKLFPSYSRCIDLAKDQQLDLVAGSLLAETALMEKNHWAYDINRHQALYELRDALREEIAKANSHE